MQEVPLLPLWMTLFLTIWAAVGPLVGILVGHYLTASWQRKQWIADNQKDEYRRVLAGLNRLNVLLTQAHTHRTVDVQKLMAAMEEVTLASNTCLFTNEFFEESKALGDVLEASRTFGQGGSYDNYHQEYWKAVNTIIAAAKKSMR